MPITTEQKLVNERWLLNVARMSNNWIWIDKGHTYPIKEDKFYPPNKTAFNDLKAIVSPQFIKNNIVWKSPSKTASK